MDNHSMDRRVKRTRDNLYFALQELMNEKRYDKITIQNIIDRANVGRSTFYAHFETKDDLLFSRAVGYLSGVNDYVLQIMNASNEAGQLISLEGLFEHVTEYQDTIRTLFISDSMGFFRKKATDYWKDTIEEFLKERLEQKKLKLLSSKDKEQQPVIPPDVLSTHIAMTLISMLEPMLDKKTKHTPKEMDTYFQQLIKPSLEAYL